MLAQVAGRTSVVTQEPVNATVRTLQIGALGPSFADVHGTDGRRHSLADAAGARAIVLIFTANRCPTAKSHAGRIEATRERFEPRGVRFYLINSNDPHVHPEERFERMLERAAADDLRVPYLRDADQAIARAYGPTCTFHAFVLDADGRLAYEGRFDDARLAERVTTRDVETALEDLLAGLPVTNPRAPAFGCALDYVGDVSTFALLAPSTLDFAKAAAIVRINPTTGTRSAAGTISRTGLGTGLAVASAGAWAITSLAGLAGGSSILDHDALIHGSAFGPPPPIWLAVVGFLVVWQVMLVAMMVPASAPAVRVVGQALAARARPILEGAAFVAAFAGVWSVFGILAFGGDWILHHVVDATPWLAARPELIQAGVLGLAGIWQFSPWKRRGLEACRAPMGVAACCVPAERRAGLRAGIRHAVDCLGASWALMLLMFAVGVSDLAWMVALTGIMAYEVRADDGLDASPLFGVFLLGFAGARLFGVLPLG